MTVFTPVITIDGPSGAGKGTLCKAMAEALQWHLLDSGIFYRILALIALYKRIDISSERELASLVTYLNVHFISINGNLKVIFRGVDVSNEIRNQKLANIASQIAEYPLVREALLHYQRTFRKAPGLIADGRDMGTVVFPDAPIKIFLDASLEKRAQRRLLQLQASGFSVNLSLLLSEIKERDYRDRNRIVAPLIPAKGALVLDSTSLTVEQLIKKVLKYVRRKLALI